MVLPGKSVSGIREPVLVLVVALQQVETTAALLDREPPVVVDDKLAAVDGADLLCRADLPP